MAIFNDLEDLIGGGLPPGQTVAGHLAELGAPSTSIAVLEDGEVSLRCYSTIGDDTETVFQAASISKPVTAMAVMRLVDQSRLAFDSTIGSLLPTNVLGEITNGYSQSQAAIFNGITVEQLLSHTAGLSQHGFPGFAEDPVPSTREVLSGNNPANTMRVRLVSLPGHSFSYSGGGITVLQLVLETVTGKDFPSLMKDLVLDPLKMSRSFFGDIPSGEANWAKAHLTGYTSSFVTHCSYNPVLAAAGLWTTPTDLLKVVIALQKSLIEDAFLRQETAKKMLTEVKSRMGLAWFLSENDVGFQHGGDNFPGFNCTLSGYASLGPYKSPDNCGIAVMTNSIQGERVCRKVNRAIRYLKGWPVFENSGSNDIQIPFPALNTLMSATWKSWIGKWTDGRHTHSLENSDGRPVFLINNSNPLNLLPAAMPSTKEYHGHPVFILEGFDMIVRLAIEAEKPIIALGSELSNEEMVLKQVF